MHPSIEQFFLQLPEEKRQLAMLIREIILSVNSEMGEAIKWNGLMFFIKKKHIAFIYTYKNLDYINLAFIKAVALSDPKNLFEGTGKGMRHIKVRTSKDIPVMQIKRWVKEAIRLETAPLPKALNKKVEAP